ncbi:N-acetylglucosamine-6-phosphate deacetylase [Belliella kenyensis]|uniref:N-acetylglucosamine-6-phosphate deacetylase n=1 Tax=Belliella kenyensis TaxID=1472724 RepID=A0ABV8ERI3_9BACT|nr:amidohydrolase family protein [Belliella kenyensis]MCH7402000.1 amidohydrolase family protein [Belliella kenyensis]MDN3605164.1 amidohydrolase family protein [Belliella kenyensis]
MKQHIEAIHYQTLKPVRIEVVEELISNVVDIEDEKSEYFVAPGMIDLQINGFNGMDFNTKSLKVEDVIEVTKSLWKIGVTSYLPTIITNSDANIEKSIQTILNAINNKENKESIAGIHLEGPFLSKEDGPRGAHPIEFIRAPDWDLFCKWQDIAEGNLKIITLSPEWDNAVDFIKKCVASGVKVAIGHTASSVIQIRDAIDAGATISTHLGNATHAMMPRHSNYLWEQLASEQLWSTVIADGFHLPKSMLSVFLKVKPKKSILVSDTTKFAGMKPGVYQSIIGGNVELDEHGRLFMKDSPSFLAGSASSILDCINHLVKHGVSSLERAIDMASIYPSMALDEHLSYGIKKGAAADLIIFKKAAGKMEVCQTIKSGEVVYQCMQ